MVVCKEKGDAIAELTSPRSADESAEAEVKHQRRKTKRWGSFIFAKSFFSNTEI